MGLPYGQAYKSPHRVLNRAVNLGAYDITVIDRKEATCCHGCNEKKNQYIYLPKYGEVLCMDCHKTTLYHRSIAHLGTGSLNQEDLRFVRYFHKYIARVEKALYKKLSVGDYPTDCRRFDFILKYLTNSEELGGIKVEINYKTVKDLVWEKKVPDGYKIIYKGKTVIFDRHKASILCSSYYTRKIVDKEGKIYDCIYSH